MSYSCGSPPEKTVQEAKNELYHILRTGHQWEKVHAAEFLLNVEYHEGIYDIFYSESQQNGHIPEYRIGIWRVLYRSSDSALKNSWKDSIYRVFVNPEAPDRIHAVETLAKLKADKQEQDSSIIASALTSDILPLWFYTHWWIIPQSEDGIEKLKKFLFDILLSEESGSLIRSLAAYVIREDKSVFLTGQEWQTLKNIAIPELQTSGAGLLLLVALFSKAPENIDDTQLKEIRDALSYYKDLSQQDTYQYCLAYAEKGKTSDIDMLSDLLLRKEADVKNAAAYAILSINRRKKSII
jgi:hypothetical protein